MALNEKKTENLVRNQFRELGYYDNAELVIEEQKSDNSLISNLLKKASATRLTLDSLTVNEL